MNKSIKVIAVLFMTILLTNCATLFGGAVTESQKTKPGPGEQQRKVKVGFLIADVILFWPGLIVDFATGAIYKPSNNNTTIIKKEKKKEDSKMF